RSSKFEVRYSPQMKSGVTLMRAGPFVILAAASLSATAPQQAPPATEVFLATLDPSAGVTSWMNISNSPGYDNQPSFLPDSSAILFSSNRDGKQMDIYL